MSSTLKNIGIVALAVVAFVVMGRLENERLDDVYGHYVQATSAPADTTEDEDDHTDAYDCVWLDDECYIIEVVDYTEDEDGDKFIEYEFVDKTLYE